MGPQPDLEPLLEVDPRIRFAVLIDLEGRQRKVVARPGTESLEPEKETRLYLAQAVVGTDMARAADGFHGALRMVVVQREKVTVLIFPLYEGLVLVSAEPDLPLEVAAEVGRRLDVPGPRPHETLLRGKTPLKGDLR